MPLPTQSELMPPRPQLRTVEDTLQAKVKATPSQEDQETGQPGTSRKSREGEVDMHPTLTQTAAHSTLQQKKSALMEVKPAASDNHLTPTSAQSPAQPISSHQQ